MLFNFGGIEEVDARAQRAIDGILSDKSYLNPEKFELILREYEKRQSKLDAEVSISIKSQIQNINYAKKHIEQANKSMIQSKQRIDNINRIYEKQKKFHQVFTEINKIYTYHRNIATVLDQLKSFINLEDQIKEIKIMIQDQSLYQLLNQKMLNLVDLRENVMKKLELQKSKDIALIKRQFEQVEQLQKQFYDKVFQKFRFCIKLGKNNPTSLVSLAKIIQKGDQILEERGKHKFMKDRAITNINQSIDDKFKQKISDLQSIVEIIQGAKFVTDDLIDVLDYVVKCFPGRYKMFQIFQNRYQHNIEKYVMPKFEIIAEDKQYGNLLVLLTWIQDYECILQRAGVTSDSYIILKAKVKEIMPFFIQHNRKLIKQFIQNCINLDKKNFKKEYFQDLIRSKSQFVSHYPSDIFGFINKEAQIIKQQVRGELFIEFVRCIASELGSAQLELREEMEQQYRNVQMTKNQDIILQFEYLSILHLNNYSQCLKHASQAKEQYTDIVAEQYKDRVKKIFLTQVQKKFNQSMGSFVNMIVGIIYLDFKRTEFPQLFTQKWSEDSKRQLVSIIINSVNEQSKDIQSLITNPVNYRLVVKTNYDYYCTVYAQILIYSIKTYYGLSFKWTPKSINIPYLDRQFKKSSFKLTKAVLTEGIAKDNIIVLKSAQSMNQHLNKQFISRLQTKLNLLKQCFSKSKLEFEKLLEPLSDNYNENAIAILEITICIRQELDKSLLVRLEQIISKKNKK